MAQEINLQQAETINRMIESAAMERFNVLGQGFRTVQGELESLRASTVGVVQNVVREPEIFADKAASTIRQIDANTIALDAANAARMSQIEADGNTFHELVKKTQEYMQKSQADQETVIKGEFVKCTMMCEELREGLKQFAQATLF